MYKRRDGEVRRQELDSRTEPEIDLSEGSLGSSL